MSFHRILLSVTTVSILLSPAAHAAKKDPAAETGGGPVSGGMMNMNGNGQGTVKVLSAGAEAKAEKAGKEAAKASLDKQKANNKASKEGKK